MRKLKIFALLDVIVMLISWALMLAIDYVSTYDDRYGGLSSSLGWYTVFRIIFLISLAILVLILSIIIIRNINMRRLKIFAILDGVVMIISVIVMYIITYMDKLDDSLYAGLSSSLGWFVVFWIIFLISAVLLALALSIIIIHKIIQNMRRLKIFAILDGIVMVVSCASIYILNYIDVYGKEISRGLYTSIGWIFILWIIFLVSSAILAISLCIIIMHMIISKIIQMIKKTKNRA